MSCENCARQAERVNQYTQLISRAEHMFRDPHLTCDESLDLAIQDWLQDAKESRTARQDPERCKHDIHGRDCRECYGPYEVTAQACKFSQTKDASCCTKEPCCMDPVVTSNAQKEEK